MKPSELRQKFLDFFKAKGHVIIPSASLIPENDPSVLFTTAGMHPLVPYLLGEEHPAGHRLADVQKCIRTVDIDRVGDNRHLTFFEMLGNWGLGDAGAPNGIGEGYFKKEAIEWSFEFLTDKKIGLGLDPGRIYATVFKGEEGIPRDEEAILIWQKTFSKAGIQAEVAGDDEMMKESTRIIPLGKEDNFWIAGPTGPCGGDTEVYYDTRPQDEKMEGKFSEFINNYRLIEAWNDVFMEFNKTAEGKYEKLKQKNVDTGMGLERTLAVVNGKANLYETELFENIFRKIAEISGKRSAENENTKCYFRIIADHLKSAMFIMADDKGIVPSNLGQGYVVRRLIRRAVRCGKQLGINDGLWTKEIAKIAAYDYADVYSEIPRNIDKVVALFDEEEANFKKTLEKGLREFEKLKLSKVISGIDAFNLYQTYGFPIEITKELAKEQGLTVNEEEFANELEKHQKLSRTANVGMFKGGLADTSEEAKKLHTAAHLLLAALRKVLGDQVAQKGSNITSERMRFDFSHPEKLTPEQIQKIETLVNDVIKKDFPVTFEEMTLKEALGQNATGIFRSKYGDRVRVYTIGDSVKPFSKEICGGPHVDHTGELEHFKIIKEESSSAGVRRIKATLTKD